MNILITSASRKVALVREFMRAQAKIGKGKVIAADVNPFSAALYFADEKVLVPPDCSPLFVSTLVDLCRKNDVRLLIPTRDEELVILSENSDKFRAVGTTVMVSDPEVVSLCQDKKLFNEFCRRNKFLVPDQCSIESVSDSEFPVFVKPRSGKGGNFAKCVHSRQELAVELQRDPDLIVQEYVQLPEFSIDLFADFSGKVISIVPRERIKVIAGESVVARTVNNSVLIEEAARLAKAMHLIGQNTIQCFLRENKAVFIEVNPRFGGAASLSFSAGACVPEFLVRMLNGEHLEPIVGKFKDNYVMLRYSDEVFCEGSSF